jgi:Dipeptidyl aminopeptidases/acylaminoacyl-peptidases
MKRSKIALALTVAVSMLSLTACNDDDNDSSSSNQKSTFVSEANYALDTVDNTSSIKVMTYNMTNVQGKAATATALVLFPKATQPKDGYRVVVWEHGTVGAGDECAPSKNLIHPRFKILANTLMAAGYVIVAPDYEGLGTKGVIHTSIYRVRQIRHLLRLKRQKNIMVSNSMVSGCRLVNRKVVMHP